MSEIKKIIKDVPEVTVKLEKVMRMVTNEGEQVVRIVFRRSDDGRRTTCFFPAQTEAAETLHILLAPLVTND